MSEYKFTVDGNSANYDDSEFISEEGFFNLSIKRVKEKKYSTGTPYWLLVLEDITDSRTVFHELKFTKDGKGLTPSSDDHLIQIMNANFIQGINGPEDLVGLNVTVEIVSESYFSKKDNCDKTRFVCDSFSEMKNNF